jgi:hypothetical protein
MFRQLRVHTPAPLTPDGQRAAEQAAETFAISYTPAERRGGQTSASLEPGTVARPEATLGAPATTASISRTPSYDSATNDDLRRCARCGEQRQYCHGCHGSDGKVPDSAVMTTRAGSILVMDYS